MLKVEHPIDYLKKEEVNFQDVDPLEEELLVEQIQRSPKLKRYHRSDSDDERNKEAKLFSAISKGKLQKVQELLRSGVKTDVVNRNNKDNTPLHYAIEKGNKEIVEELLLQKWKTDINAKNNKGDTPVHIAASKGNKELVKLLLSKQAKTDIKNNESKTSLSLANKLDNSNPNKHSIIQILGQAQQKNNKRKQDQSPSDLNKRQKPDQNNSSQFVEKTLNQQDYQVWLTQEDIADVARIKYGWHGEDDNVIFEIIGLVEQLDAQLTRYKEIIKVPGKQSLTFIINLNGNVTLVITHHTQQFSVYYVDSLGCEVTSDIQDKLNSAMPRIEISNPKFKQQEDDYNCEIFALENARIINDIIQSGQINQIEQALEGYKLTSDDLKNKRKEFAEVLQ